MKDFFLITGNATVCDYSPSVQKRRAVGMKPALESMQDKKDII